MKKILFIIIIIFNFNFLTNAQQVVSLREVTKVPDVIPETSGIEITDRNRIWTHNDSGGEPKLYCFDTLGNLIATKYIANAVNIDWEEITQDDKGNFYICDFGNNTNMRQDLKIYKIPNPDLQPFDSIKADVISFKYPDQESFPPLVSMMNFDMEATFYFNDSLYLFSKNRTSPFNGYTKLYRISASSGNYSASLVDSFFTGNGLIFNYWITAADISPDNKHMVLLSYDKMWLFNLENINGSIFENYTQINFPFFSQKEGVCFISNNEIYITDELNPQGGGKLYYVNLSDWIK